MADNDEIMDGSQEMDPSSPEFAAALAALKEPKAPEAPEKKDVKKSVSSTDKGEPKEPVETDDGEDGEETVESLRAKVTGMEKELGRRKGKADKVAALEAKIAELEASQKKASADPVKERLAQVTDEDLVDRREEWEIERTRALARYDRAEENGNEEAMREAAERVKRANGMLGVIRREVADRAKQASEKESAQADFIEEITEVRDTILKLHPDLKDEDSEIWKASKAEFDAAPALMKQLGDVSNIVAIAMAIVKNPSLVQVPETPETRRNVVGKIEKGFKKALSRGAGGPASSSVAPNIDVSTPEGMAAFERLVATMKG